jgi:Fe/S biogenesis protein NfuA
MPADQAVISITDEAVAAILGIRAQEPDADDLALTVAVTGVRGVDFTYELTFIPVADAAEGDSLTHHGDLPVLVAGDSISRLEGATIQIREGGLAIDNPNSPIPQIAGGTATTEGPVAERVAAVINDQINPAIAAHGGFAELVAVEDDTAYLRLGGGCVGCGLAQVTLTQGIVVAITNAVPEIENVVDVTDHASGTDPYYESAKK